MSEHMRVMISYEEFQRLNALEESIGLQRAVDAASGGDLSADESEAFMKKRLARVAGTEKTTA